MQRSSFFRRPIAVLNSQKFCVSPRNVSTLARHALYIDRGVLVVNKPAGLVCQYNRKSELDDKLSLAAAPQEEYRQFIDDLKDRLSLANDPFPVHRLDKQTTGALLLARNQDHARTLSEQFRTHTIEKWYLALVRGGAETFSESSGTIRSAIYSQDGRISTRNPGRYESRKIAETDYEVVASSPRVPLTLVRLRPHTGLKHQLRLHMAELMKAPILGDTLHGSSKLSPKIKSVVIVPEDTLYLHAQQLSFYRYRSTGPNKRVQLTIRAPLPGYFTRICSRIDIPLHRDLVQGGLWVNGHRFTSGKGSHSTGEVEDDNTIRARKAIEDLQGYWVGKYT